MFNIPRNQLSGTQCILCIINIKCELLNDKPELWDCVGEDRRWSVVFVDLRPPNWRCPTAKRFMSRAELVIAHDSENRMDWPHNCWNDPAREQRRTYNISIKGSSTTIIEVNHS